MAEKPITENPKKNKSINGHYLKKRQVSKPEKGKTVFYVNTKTNIESLVDRVITTIINNNSKEDIVIYCLGAAIQRGILLALKLCEKQPSFQLDTNTLTTELIDDLEPAADDADYEIQRRLNSALRIRIIKTVFC